MYQKKENEDGVMVVSFSYEVNDIFNKVAMKSAYNAKNIRNKDGQSLVDDFAITEDEKDIFQQCLRSVLPEIYSIVLKITSGVSDAFNFDVTGATVSLSVMDNEAYNENILSLVEQSISECLVEGTLMEWYRSTIHADLLNMYSKSFGMSLEKLFSRLFQLRKKKVYSMLGDIY